MSKRKQKLPIIIVWWETIFTIIISWVIKKFLDYLWTKGKTTFRKPRPKGDSTLMRKLGLFLMNVSYKMLVDLETSSSPSSTNSFILHQFEFPYMLHDFLHELGVLKIGECTYCETIMLDRDMLKRFTPNIELYLPFKNRVDSADL